MFLLFSPAASFHDLHHHRAVLYLTWTGLILKAYRAPTGHRNLRQAVGFAPLHPAASLRLVDIVVQKEEES